LPDGTYFFNVTANDTAGNRNVTLQTRTIVVDTTVPVPSYGGGTDANNSFVPRNFIIVNVTVTELNLNITNVSLYNASGFLNQTNITFFNSTNPTYFNYSGLADGVYFFNATANDTAGNRNVTLQTRTITVDTVAPALTLTEQAVTSDSINVSISAVDATSGVNGSCTVDRSGASVSGTGASQQLYESGLTCSTAYSYTVTCLDRAGNSPSRAITVSTLGCDVGAGRGGAGGGAGTAGERWTNTIIVKEEQIERGYSRELKEKERVSVKIDNVAHHIGVVSIDNVAKKATIEVASTPQKITLGEGETKKVEVTNDTYYDLQVTLNSIKNGKADVLIKSIRELIAPAAREQQPSEEQQPPSAEEEQQPVGEEGAVPPPAEEKPKSTLTAIIGALILAVIIVIVLIIIVQHRKSFGY
jgi:CheY-specific phosphatase CheX